MIKSPLPLLGFAAYSGTGKTTLLCQLIPLLKAKGIRVAVLKHAHHDFDIDHLGKDSYELRESGACNVVIASRKRTAIIIEHPDNQKEPSLEDALKQVNDVISPINAPSHRNSAMDGYAISSDDLPTNSAKTYPVSGIAYAGKPSTKPHKKAQLTRIMTGAVMPEGTDTVIMQKSG
jgi:molybdopterin-guanine dinucleotide biosynthesis protein